MLSWTGSPAGPSSGNKRRIRGFTLLEVIVAFTILAVALVGLLQAFGTGMRGLGAAQASATAVMHARSKLDEIGQVIALEESQLTGAYKDGYRWNVRIAGVEGDTGGPAALARLFDVEVTVTSARGKAFTLNTLRLGGVR